MDMKLLHGDCLELLAEIPDGSIDLIVTDPPYEIETQGGGNDEIKAKLSVVRKELDKYNISTGFNIEILNQIIRVMKNINIYIWCNHKQIPLYLNYFVENLKCKFDILVWVKDNPVPLFNNKYLTDKEYCLYFRRGGYCQPESYDMARTAFFQPLNVKDKQTWNHPTVKPLNIIQTLILNSSKEGDLVLDPFMGSGTTGVACALTKRNFIGMEINEEFFKMAEQRIKTENQPRLF